MRRMKGSAPDDLRPEDLLTDELPRARSPPKQPWWLPDSSTSWTEAGLMLFVYCTPAITLLLKDC